VSRTQTLLTKIRQVCSEIRDIKLDAQSHQRNDKYVYSANRKHTRGVHTINKINIQNKREDGITNNHKFEREDIHGRGHKDCNYSSGKSPTCLTDVGSNTYSHDDCGEHPTQTLSCLTPETLKSSHVSPPDPSESTPTPPELPPSSPVLCQSVSLSDPSPFSSSESLDSELTSSRGGMTLDSDSVLAVVLDDPVESGDRVKGVLQRAAKTEPRSSPPTEDRRFRPPLQK
jgi:hypothetical protein